MVKYTTYTLRKGQLSGGGPRKKPKPSIFIAYSFGKTDSQRFRDNLEEAIRRSHSLSQVEVQDGHVRVGASWPTEIRRRLKAARLVVADLSVLSPEVLFECGFAWGLHKAILPVTSESGGFSHLPNWMKEIQFGIHSASGDLASVVDAISQALNDKRRSPAGANGSSPNPRNIALIAPPSCEHVIDQVRHGCGRYGFDLLGPELTGETMSDIGDGFVSAVASASLFVGRLGNTDLDNQVHFGAGMVCAVPNAGVSKVKFQRRVLLVVGNDERPEVCVSDSARRVAGIVKVIRESQIGLEITAFVQAYRLWEKKVGAGNVLKAN